MVNMKTHSNAQPERIQRLGLNLYAYNHNIQEVEDGYDYEAIHFDHIPSANEIINHLVSLAYPDGEELAIQRKGIIDPQNNEFVAYYQNVEQIKAKIKLEYESDSMAE